MRRALVLMIGMSSLAFAEERADAFSGIFLADDDKSTQVREHRIAIAMLPGKTVLWDQPQWSGNPTTLASITPVKPGATVTVGSDAWFAALDGSTQPVIFKPPEFGVARGCAIGERTAIGAPSPFGFLGGCTSDSAYGAGPDKITVTKRAVIGPAETVTLTSAAAVTQWLTDNRFSTIDSQTSAIAAYASEGFEFVVMRFFPKCGETATRPIRVTMTTTSGSDAARTIPTRLMPIGAGLTLRTTLYVLAQDRFAVAGATNASIPLDELTWDDDERSSSSSSSSSGIGSSSGSGTGTGSGGRYPQSNYAELRERALLSSASGTWLTEYAATPQRSTSTTTSNGSSGGSSGTSAGGGGTSSATPSLFELYPGVCGRQTLPSRVDLQTPNSGASFCGNNTPSRDSGADARVGDEDASALGDASLDGALATDAGQEEDEDAGLADDAGSGEDEIDDAGSRIDASSFPPAQQDACTVPDDLTIAFEGVDLNGVFLTRMQANASANILSRSDLLLVQTPNDIVTNGLQAVSFEDEKRQYPNRSSTCESSLWTRTRPFTTPTITALVLAIAIRRRRRRP